MENLLHQFLPVWRTVRVVCVFMAVIPIPAICESIDHMLIKRDANLRAFDMFHVNENFTVDMRVELDMLMSLEQFKEMYSPVNSTRSKRAVKISYRWSNATIPYDFDPKIRHGAKAIRDTLDHFEKYTCLNFVENSTAPYRLHFKRDIIRCASYVGITWSGVQPVYLADWCLKKNYIAHEVAHAVGFYHEHCRPDRDSYVYIPPQYAESINYKKATNIRSFGVPYDYLSISHYEGNDIVVARDPAYQGRIGRGPGLSYKDIKQINLMYFCAPLRAANCQNTECPFNGFVLFKAFKGQPACQCFCDSGDQEDPIVPCSSITKEVPGPNIVAGSSLATPDPNQCFNLRSDCDSLKIKGMCEKEPGRMLEQCTKTCGFCERAKDLCFDRDPGCEMMAASCTDSALEDLMSQRCRKTCKLCTQPSSACELQQSMSDSMPSTALGQAKPIDILLVVQFIVVVFFGSRK